MIRAIFLDAQLQVPKTVDETDILRIVQGKSGCLWVDIQGEARESIEPLLREAFGFHPLAIEDALHQTHIPKIDDWDGYLYLVLHAVDPGRQEDPGDTLEIDLFVSAHYLVTYQASPASAVEQVWEIAQQNRAAMARGPARLLYRIIDEVETSFVPLFSSMDEQLARIETEIFQRPSQSLLAEIFSLKRSLLGLRRIIVPQREVISKLARGSYERFSSEERMYFHDVYDHMVQLGDMLENLRDIVNGALEMYLSAASNRLNDVLKTLTIITTLFMPLSFIVGFFGMNFFQATDPFEPWTARSAFVAAVALMIITPLAMVLWLRRRGWI